MARYTKAKAVILKLGKSEITVTTDDYHSKFGYACKVSSYKYALEEADDKGTIAVTSIKGNKKFTESTKSEVKAFIDILKSKNEKAKKRILAAQVKEDKEHKAWVKKNALETKKREDKRIAELESFIKKHALPKGVKLSDLKNVSYKNALQSVDLGVALYGSHHTFERSESSFELWYSEKFGWVVPTLHISNASRGSNHQDRHYAVALDTMTMCRVGKGPHILKTTVVNLKKGNIKRLLPVIEKIAKGAISANETRDRISTRRANSRRSSWGW